jgi:putative protease
VKRIELLAPAGNLEKLKTAIHYGADAVYLGLSDLSLRAKANNFDDNQLAHAVSYAQEQGVLCYVTINIFPHNRDLELIRDHVQILSAVKPDAVIVSDPGIFALVSRETDDIDIHVSTQANITNTESALFWERQGAKRLILSRELNINEIKEIRENIKVELESFVHGAVCISYSGRCYMSAFLANRSGNSGACTNSCRWNYTLMEEKRQGEYFPVYENDRGTYIMSSRDLCMIEHLDKLKDAGIDSFKLEGRTKGINYIAGVVKTYREAINRLNEGSTYKTEQRWLDELNMFSSRGYTTGMYLGPQDAGDYNHDEKEVYRMSHELVGIIQSRNGSKAKVLMRNNLSIGEKVEFLTTGLEGKMFPVDALEDEDHSPLESTRNDEIVWLPVPEEVRAGDLIRRQKS